MRKILDVEDGKGAGSRVTKAYLVMVRGHGCEVCHTVVWEGHQVPLILDHIDGNSSNQKLTNLRLVCGNCDMQLPTYKNKNRGKGRHTRLQRYKKGLSH